MQLQIHHCDYCGFRLSHESPIFGNMSKEKCCVCVWKLLLDKGTMLVTSEFIFFPFALLFFITQHQYYCPHTENSKWQRCNNTLEYLVSLKAQSHNHDKNEQFCQGNSKMKKNSANFLQVYLQFSSNGNQKGREDIADLKKLVV